MMKKNNSIILLLIAIFSCSLAQGITIISIPWYFTDNLNASSTFSLLYAGVTFIGLFWGLYAGVIIDFYNRKKILLLINLICSIIFFISGLTIYFSNQGNSFLFFLAFAICSFYYTIFFPNLYAIAQEISSKKQYVTINSFIEIFFQATTIISALLCAILLSESKDLINYFKLEFLSVIKLNMGQILILNSILYLITFILLLFINYVPKKKYKKINFYSTLREIKIAISFLIKNKKILIYGICSQAIFAFLIVELFTLLPLFVKNCLNENIITFSLADLVYAVGALSAGIITAKILKHIKKIPYSIFLIILTGYAFLIMISHQELNIFFITSFIVGLTNASVRITRMSYFFETIPNYLIGRSNTIFNAINTIIRGFLILIYSLSWFSEEQNVVIGYKIGIFFLILFAIPLMYLWFQKKLN
ncbi:MAG: hypothetical protein CMP49_04250 [Flavobacteriales bacterium]|nr:hypothetical protein [Flavobacteriales bacterium]